MGSMPASKMKIPPKPRRNHLARPSFRRPRQFLSPSAMTDYRGCEPAIRKSLPLSPWPELPRGLYVVSACSHLAVQRKLYGQLRRQTWRGQSAAV